VVGVADGDTIEVMHLGRAQKIRLAGIDCPERKQAFGTRAKQFTADMVFGKVVTVKIQTIDQYGRTVGEVILPDGKSLNRELVKAGFAWWYRQYSNDETLGELEEEARSARVGLWADSNPVPPWEYRKLHKALR
jgi:endonuclease YncB( thermonuclease family)